MCGLLLLTYAATGSPAVVLDGSYTSSYSLRNPDVVRELLGAADDNLGEVNDGRAEAEGQQGVSASRQYRYPLATAIISVSHQFFTHPMVQAMMTSHTELLDILASDIVGSLLAHASEVAHEFFASREFKAAGESASSVIPTPQGEDGRQLARERATASAQIDYSCVCSARELIHSLSEEERAQLVSSKEELLHWYGNNLRYRLGEIALAEEKRQADSGERRFIQPCVSAYLKPRDVYKALVSLFDHRDYQFLPLSAAAPPQLGGCILELCVGLVRVLDKRLSHRPVGQQYLEFNSMLRQVLSDFESLVDMSRYSRVYSVSEVLRILEEGWAHPDGQAEPERGL